MDERMGTHWDTCATDGGPRHYDCALRLIAKLRGENERVLAANLHVLEWQRNAEADLAAAGAMLAKIARFALGKGGECEIVANMARRGLRDIGFDNPATATADSAPAPACPTPAP